MAELPEQHEGGFAKWGVSVYPEKRIANSDALVVTADGSVVLLTGLRSCGGVISRVRRILGRVASYDDASLKWTVGPALFGLVLGAALAWGHRSVGRGGWRRSRGDR
jgi:hypothetical protein